MTLQHAIESAIKGGWNGYSGIGNKPYPDTKKQRDQLIKLISGKHGDIFMNGIIEGGVIDPSFWKCLGKSEGWEMAEDGYRESDGLILYTEGWKKEWHRLVNHLIQGGTIESFFETL